LHVIHNDISAKKEREVRLGGGGKEKGDMWEKRRKRKPQPVLGFKIRNFTPEEKIKRGWKKIRRKGKTASGSSGGGLPLWGEKGKRKKKK